MRVLIGDARRLVAVGLKAHLEGLGHQVVGWARDTHEVLDYTVTLRPELILIDARLPGTNGIDAARVVLARQAIPVVLLTDYAAADLVRRAQDAGVMACLVKPMDPRRLRSTIEVALGRFEELRAIREDTSDLKEALEIRKLVEQAKHVLMMRLRLSEREAFRRMHRQSRDAKTALREVAVAVSRTEDLLSRRPDVTRRLQALLDAIRRGLSGSACSDSPGWTPRPPFS